MNDISAVYLGNTKNLEKENIVVQKKSRKQLHNRVGQLDKG